MNIEDLTKLYGNLSIMKLESMALALQKNAAKYGGELTGLLYYLDYSKLFRKLPDYKKATFEQYLNNIFGMTVGRYNADCKAYFGFPEEVKEINIGVVKRTISKCDVLVIPKVFKKIMAIKGRRTPEKMNEIIDEFAKAKPKGIVTILREKIRKLDRIIAQRDNFILELKTNEKELTEENIRLKATIKTNKEELTEENIRLKATIRELKVIKKSANTFLESIRSPM